MGEFGLLLDLFGCGWCGAHGWCSDDGFAASLAVYEYFADFTAESCDGVVCFAFSHFDLVFLV